MDMSIFDQHARRKAQCERILELDSDIVLMQECQKSELDQLMSSDEGILSAKYDVEFCAFPPTFWSNWLSDASQHKPCENGVCVLTKKSIVSKFRAEHVSIDLPEWEVHLPKHSLGARACLVYATVPSWRDAKILIVCSHLDADSVRRAGMQGVELAKTVRKIVDSTEDLDTTIWGGDFNMEMRCPSMRAIQAEGFKLASNALRSPTVFAVACTVRVDHVMYYCKVRGKGNKQSNPQPVATFVPQCPQGHWISVVPFLSEMQWLKAYGLNGEGGSLVRALCILLVMFLLPLILALFIPMLVHFCDRNKQCERLSWALAEWGSDHLPVTVCMQCAGEAIGPLVRKPCRKRTPLQKLRSTLPSSVKCGWATNVLGPCTSAKLLQQSDVFSLAPDTLRRGASLCCSLLRKCKLHKKRQLLRKPLLGKCKSRKQRMQLWQKGLFWAKFIHSVHG